MAKTLGAVWLLMFVPALLAILPGHLRWMGAMPIEGLAGRIVGDVLIRYLNVAGRIHRLHDGSGGRALPDHGLLILRDSGLGSDPLRLRSLRCGIAGKTGRTSGNANASRKSWRSGAPKGPSSPTQLVPARPAAPRPETRVRSRNTAISRACRRPPAPRTGIERMAEEDEAASRAASGAGCASAEIEVTDRADTEHKAKTTLPKIAGSYKLPPSSLLHRPDEQQAVHEDELKLLAQVLTDRYAEFDVHGQVTQINPGPVVTTFEYKPEAGIKYSRIIGLTDDLCLALRAESILVERMPGKSTVGIQVPNREREIIWLRENIESQEFIGSKSKLTLAMGKDINGRLAVADLAGMPHLLIAGSTGTGKSVAINAMIMSILYKSTPDQVRLVLVDPKRLELGQLRRRSASLHADHHRAETGGQRAAQRRPRNGAPPETAGREGRPQHRPVQPRSSTTRPACSREQSDEGPIPVHRHHHRRVGRPDDARRPQRGRIDHASRRRWRAPSAFTWCWPRSARRWTSSPD